MGMDEMEQIIETGADARHTPVMLKEVLEVLEGCSSTDSNKLNVIDGTFGAGGYTSAMLERGYEVLAIDRDPDAIRDGQALMNKHKGKCVLVRGTFADLERISALTGFQSIDGIVLDIGVSSMQIDQAGRGFSFQKDGPLDMRMSQSGVSAADVVNNIAQNDLTRLIGLLGEERKASQISRAIVREREAVPFSTTGQLAKLIEKVIGRRPGDKIHPATRTFQALRIFVNQELEQLGKALFAAERVLSEGGRLVVVTFHSLEDRMVKLFFKDRIGGQQGSRHLPIINQNHASFSIEGKGLLKASKDEADVNPRARSAKLRWGTRTSSADVEPDMALFGLPSLASLKSLQSAGKE